jgi:soluble lytic murein transglycosylase-like protein
MIRGAKATIVGMLFCLIAEPSIAQPADAMVRASAALHDVPVDLALAVSQKESGTSCAAVGRKGERGPLQILPSTARALGYKNIAKASCAQQTDAGMKHLAICYRGMGGNRWAAAACHNQGISAIRHIRPAAKRYADSVMGVPPTRRQRINYLAPAAPRGGL